MTLPVAPVYPAGLVNPSMSQASGIPVSLGSLLLNCVDANNVEWWLDEKSMNEWGTSSSTIQLSARPRSDGVTTSTPFSNARHLPITIWITAPDPAALTTALDQLYAAASLQPTLLAVNEQGLIRHMYVQREDLVLTTRLGQFSAVVSFQVVAGDPTKYGDIISATTSLPTFSGGRTYPNVYPEMYTGVANTGTINIVNAGNTSAPIWFQATGNIPVGGWQITHLGQKTSLVFSSSLALGLNEFVTIDMRGREVLAQGQDTASRNGWVTSRGWFDLDPGPNQIAFTSAVYDPSASLTAYTFSAWS